MWKGGFGLVISVMEYNQETTLSLDLDKFGVLPIGMRLRVQDCATTKPGSNVHQFGADGCFVSFSILRERDTFQVWRLVVMPLYVA